MAKNGNGVEWKENKDDFDDLYNEIIETKKKVEKVERQIVSMGSVLHYCVLNQNEVYLMKDDAKIYQSIGRMFIVRERKQILDLYKKQQDEIALQIDHLGAAKYRLQVHQKNKTDNLREIIQAHKERSKNNDN